MDVRKGENKEMRETRLEMEEWSEICFEGLRPEHAGGCKTCMR